MSSTLEITDPILYSFIEYERYRQRSSPELIASENFTYLALKLPLDN